MRISIMLTALFCLAACGRSGEDQAPADHRDAPETGAAAEVARLDEGLRNGVFEKAIRDSGSACPAVVKSERAQVRTGVKGWKVECDNGTAHLIDIGSDGTANVTSRTH